MQTARRIVARPIRFALTFRTGSDSGLYAVFLGLAIIGAASPRVWLACAVVGALLIARGLHSERVQRAVREANREREDAMMARYRMTYAPTYASYAPTYASFDQN